MKTIMLIMTLMGFALSGYAQKIVYRCPYGHIHKSPVSHKKVAAAPKKAKVKTTTTKANTWDALVSCGSNSVSCTNETVSTSRSFSGYSDVDLESSLVPLYNDLVVTSPAFKDNNEMPAKYTCEGQQVSPPLDVFNIPQGTQALALIMDDPHATPSRGTTFWLMWNVDTDTVGRIPENFHNDNSARLKESMQYGYQAVCPIDGKMHDYHIRVYALDTKLKLDRRKTDKLALQRAMQGHVLAKGGIVGRYTKTMD
jgi:Raf kinase inhibitor-like YbhB/YbcL family protein